MDINSISVKIEKLRNALSIAIAEFASLTNSDPKSPRLKILKNEIANLKVAIKLLMEELAKQKES